MPDSKLKFKRNIETTRSYCQRFGADLVAVETPKEWEFIRRVVDVEEADMPGSQLTWILGGKRKGIGHPFKWVQTDKEITFTDWHGWFPKGTANEETVFVYMSWRGKGRKWHAASYSVSRFICEGTK